MITLLFTFIMFSMFFGVVFLLFMMDIAILKLIIENFNVFIIILFLIFICWLLK